jgi:D-alanyl-D-alanine carboxypeptidase/D-alanyl-D-alanine-endopeptidase (penicillin-binding protein 4)
MLNFGSVAVGVYPDPSMTRPTVAIDPFPVNGISLNNQLLWGSSNSVEIKRVKSQSQGDLIYLGGAVKKSGSLKKYYQSVSDGMSFTTEFIFSALKNVNIRVKGRLRRENRDSSGLTKFYDISGYNLKKWLEGMNTYSNNQIADLLGFLLSKDNADENLKTLSSSGNSTTGITIEAWSGLSTKNRFSSDFLARSLSESVANFQIFPTLLQSLPTPLSNGTLSRRGFSEAVKPVLRAKTGTLTEPYPVSSLAGYLDHPTSGVIAFSIILNDSNRATGLDKLKILEEKIINSVFALKSF